MISPPFDFNVRVKMFIMIMLTFSFFLAYFICLDMLLLLLLFKFSLFVWLFFWGFFVLQIWFVNTYRLSAISYQCPMGHRKPRGVSKGERLRLSWFLYWKKRHQFCCSWYYILNYWFQSNFLSKSFQNQLQYCTFTLIVGKCRVKFWKSNQCTDEQSLIYK